LYFALPTTVIYRGRTPSFSSDANNLAAIGGLDESSILVYDVENNRKLEICSIAEGDNPLNSAEGGAIIWSPDGQFLAHGKGPDPSLADHAIVTLNVYSGQMMLLQSGAGVKIFGWSADEKWLKP
jgi:WD40 repeat protein